jgi:hypothetical protein
MGEKGGVNGRAPKYKQRARCSFAPPSVGTAREALLRRKERRGQGCGERTNGQGKPRSAIVLVGCMNDGARKRVEGGNGPQKSDAAPMLAKAVVGKKSDRQCIDDEGLPPIPVRSSCDGGWGWRH